MFRLLDPVSPPIAGSITATLLLLGAAVSGSVAAPPSPFPEATRAKLDAALKSVRAKLKVPGVIVSLYIPGEGLWETAVGVSDEKTNKPLVAGMHTRIGSLTKTFTITAVLQLADQKKLNLDDPISKYLDFVPNGDHITLRQMAGMRSGLYSYTKDDPFVAAFLADPHKTYTARQLVNFGLPHPPLFAPGTRFDYCNSNTVLLGMVIEKVSGTPVGDFITQNIIRRLGLRHTSWPTTADMPTPFSHGYTKQTPDGSKTDATFFNPSWANAAGELISDRDDLKKWVVALGEGTLLSKEMQKERLTFVTAGGPKMGYGLGIGHYSGWVGHTGELPGYNTGAYYLASKRAALVIQTNSDIPLTVTGSDGKSVEASPVASLFREIAKIVTPNNVPDGPQFPDITYSSK